MTIKEFIEKARKGSNNTLDFECDMAEEDGELGNLLLNPEAWQAIAKVEGWEAKQHPHARLTLQKEYDCYIGCETCLINKRIKPYQYEMHRMIDALAEGKSISDFIKTL